MQLSTPFFPPIQDSLETSLETRFEYQIQLDIPNMYLPLPVIELKKMKKKCCKKYKKKGKRCSSCPGRKHN